MPTEVEQCSYGQGPPERNCILQCMRINSRLYHKCFCRRKICFTFLGPLCILISFSGTAAAVNFSIRGDVYVKYILLSLPSCPKWIFMNCLVQQTQSILVAVLPATQLSFAACLFLSLPEEKRVQQLSVSHLFTCRNIQTLLCVYLKASNEGNVSCNAARDIETCEETFFWFFGSRFQEESISWML